MALHTIVYFLVIHCISMAIADAQCILIKTYLYAALRLFSLPLVKSVALESRKPSLSCSLKHT